MIPDLSWTSWKCRSRQHQKRIPIKVSHAETALTIIAACLVAAVNVVAQPDPNYKPMRLNKAIELLEDGQTIYYTGAGGGFGGEGSGPGRPLQPAQPTPMPGYEEGKKMAQTWADMIIYEMEHQPLAVERLREFMKGIAEGGPTKSGHRMPTVVATLPVLGYDTSYLKANSWVIAEVLATGVMGIHLCHARDPEGVGASCEPRVIHSSGQAFDRPLKGCEAPAAKTMRRRSGGFLPICTSTSLILGRSVPNASSFSD